MRLGRSARTAVQYLLWLWVRALAFVLPRVRIGRRRVERLSESGAPFAYACLHGDSLLLLPTHLHEPLSVLVSKSSDGRLAAGLLTRLGLDVVHGSTSKGAVSGLRSLSRQSQRGSQAVITVDGPRGPAGEVAQGVLALARLRSLWVVPVVASCRGGITLNSWDSARIPWPWTRVVIAYGRPFRVGRNDRLTTYQHSLKAQLTSLRTRATRLCGRAEPLDRSEGA